MTIEELYRENHQLVYGFVLSLCGDPALAEDLAAETFLRAIEHPAHFDGRAKPSTWLCAVAKNLYLNECRSRTRRKRAFARTAEQKSSEGDVQTLQERVREVLWTARGLPEAQRQVLRMRLEGMSYAEIGDCLGKGESWARVTFFRAKNRLLQELEEGS